MAKNAQHLEWIEFQQFIQSFPDAGKRISDWIFHTAKEEMQSPVSMSETMYHEYFNQYRMEQFLNDHGIKDVPSGLDKRWELITDKLKKKYPRLAEDFTKHDNVLVKPTMQQTESLAEADFNAPIDESTVGTKNPNHAEDQALRGKAPLVPEDLSGDTSTEGLKIKNK